MGLRFPPDVGMGTVIDSYGVHPDMLVSTPSTWGILFVLIGLPMAVISGIKVFRCALFLWRASRIVPERRQAE